MRTIMILMLILSSISLSACSNMAGNVVPRTGPTMEQVYDNMEHEINGKNITQIKSNSPPIPTELNIKSSLPVNAKNSVFRKIPNPELKMYVYPHLAGRDEIPIPGYYTAFDAYTQNHYGLKNETI